MASAISVGAGADRAIVTLGEWFKKQRRPLEEGLWRNLYNIARQSTDRRAAVRAMQLIADRIDPAPKAVEAEQPAPIFNIAIVTNGGPPSHVETNGGTVRIVRVEGNGA